MNERHTPLFTEFVPVITADRKSRAYLSRRRQPVGPGLSFHNVARFGTSVADQCAPPIPPCCSRTLGWVDYGLLNCPPACVGGAPDAGRAKALPAPRQYGMPLGGSAISDEPEPAEAEEQHRPWLRSTSSRTGGTARYTRRDVQQRLITVTLRMSLIMGHGGGLADSEWFGGLRL